MLEPALKPRPMASWMHHNVFDLMLLGLVHKGHKVDIGPMRKLTRCMLRAWVCSAYSAPILQIRTAEKAQYEALKSTRESKINQITELFSIQCWRSFQLCCWNNFCKQVQPHLTQWPRLAALLLTGTASTCIRHASNGLTPEDLAHGGGQ